MSKSGKSGNNTASNKNSSSTTNKPKTSYIDDLDEDQINEDKAEFRYEQMMKSFKKLTRSDENEEENENLNRFYKENAPKKRDNYKVPELKSKNEEKDFQTGLRAPNELKEEVINCKSL